LILLLAEQRPVVTRLDWEYSQPEIPTQRANSPHTPPLGGKAALQMHYPSFIARNVRQFFPFEEMS